MALAVLIIGSTPVAARKKTRHRVVMQVSGSDTTEWKGTINNLKNLKKGWDSDVAIEVVAHGPGIAFLLTRKTTQGDAIRALTAQGVQFVICENSLLEKKVGKQEVMPEAGLVPMGIGEIALKQEDGWSHIKSGF